MIAEISFEDATLAQRARSLGSRLGSLADARTVPAKPANASQETSSISEF